MRVRATADDDDAAAGSSGGHWYDRPCGPNSLEVSSVQELVDVLATDRLVVVDFFAPWCGACRALFPKLSKLLAEYPDVLLVKVNFEANRAMCKSMGIKVLPFFHFYHGSLGRVAAFSATVSKLQRLKEALDTHSGAICSLEEPPGLEEFPGEGARPRGGGAWPHGARRRRRARASEAGARGLQLLNACSQGLCSGAFPAQSHRSLDPP